MWSDIDSCDFTLCPVLAMVEKCRKTLNAGGETGAVLTDLSKAFDSIDYNLQIPKLSANAFEKQSIDLFIFTSLNVKKEQKLTLSSVHGKCYF